MYFAAFFYAENRPATRSATRMNALWMKNILIKKANAFTPAHQSEYPAKSLRIAHVERTATGNIISAEDKARLSGFLRSVPVGGSGVTPSGAWGGIK